MDSKLHFIFLHSLYRSLGLLPEILPQFPLSLSFAEDSARAKMRMQVRYNPCMIPFQPRHRDFWGGKAERGTSRTTWEGIWGPRDNRAEQGKGRSGRFKTYSRSYKSSFKEDRFGERVNVLNLRQQGACRASESSSDEEQTITTRVYRRRVILKVFAGASAGCSAVFLWFLWRAWCVELLAST